MAEYIERESALQALCEAVHAKDGNIPCRNQLVSCLWTETRTKEYAEKILAIPAADVVPVVRCGECRYAYDSVGGWCCSHGICVDCIVREDFFCADGERLTNGMDGDGDV